MKMLRTLLLSVVMTGLLSVVAAAKNTNLVVDGWYNDGWETESHQVYKNNADVFSDCNPFWYDLGKGKTDGSLFERKVYTDYGATELAEIHARGALCVPTLSDTDAGQINTIFADHDGARQNLIDNLVNKAVDKNFDGWDLDFEGGAAGSDLSGQKLYTDFVRDLAMALKQVGKVLDITLGAFDTDAHAEDWIMNVDGLKSLTDVRYFKIMAYNQCLVDNEDDTPSPVGTVDWIKSCLDYMVVKHGLPANRVLLGLPNFSWIWKKTGSSPYSIVEYKPYTYITGRPGVAIAWHLDTFTYPDGITYHNTAESTATWTEGGSQYFASVTENQSVAARLPLINTYGLKGAAFFVLGREDSAIYDKLRAFEGSYALAGRVTILNNGSAQGLSGVTLKATRTSDSATFTTTTDSDGRYLFSSLATSTLTAGTYTLAPQNAGLTYTYAPSPAQSQPLTLSASLPTKSGLNFVAKPLLSGTVYNAVALAGLSGIVVKATRQSDGNVFAAGTDAAGTYKLPLEAGTYTLTAFLPHKDGFIINPAFANPVSVKATLPTSVPGYNFRALGIGGRIVTPSNAGVSGVTVNLYAQNDTAHKSALRTGVTNAQGFFSLDGVAAGTWLVVPVAPTSFAYTPASRPVTVADKAVFTSFTAKAK